MTEALFKRESYDFNELYESVYAKLRARKAASGGEEMLRLRLYEKLQMLVAQGLVRREQKRYSAIRRALRAHLTAIAAANAKFMRRRDAIHSD